MRGFATSWRICEATETNDFENHIPFDHVFRYDSEVQTRHSDTEASNSGASTMKQTIIEVEQMASDFSSCDLVKGQSTFEQMNATK